MKSVCTMNCTKIKNGTMKWYARIISVLYPLCNFFCVVDRITVRIMTAACFGKAEESFCLCEVQCTL